MANKRETDITENKVETRSHQLAVRVTKSEFEAFKLKAKMEGKNYSHVLLEFVLDYIDNPSSGIGMEERVRSLEEKIQELQQNMGKIPA